MESEALMLSQIVDALQEGGKQNPRLWEKYLLKPLHDHYDNAHEEMTLKFNILAKSEGGGGDGTPQQHNIFSGCGSGSGAVY